MSAEMHVLGDPARHFWLTRSVARTMGVNLSEAMAMNQLNASGYSDMVNKCRCCQNADACQAWLAIPHDFPASAPDHCVNGDLLNRLAQETAA